MEVDCCKCGEPVEEGAARCPHCGARDPSNTLSDTSRSPASGDRASTVFVGGIDVPFGQLVYLLIKLAVASIPAAIILAIVGVLGGIFAS